MKRLATLIPLNLLKALTLLPLVMIVILASTPKKAEAYTCICLPCLAITALHLVMETTLATDIQDKITDLFEDVIIEDFTQGLLGGTLKGLALELVSGNHAVTAMVGAMIDGQTHSTAMLEMQTQMAETTQDHIPSVSVCTFASLARSIGGADHRKDLTNKVLSQYAIERQLGVPGNMAADGVSSKSTDLDSRFRQFVTTYCDPKDQNGELGVAFSACNAPDQLINRDVDFTGVIDRNMTLEIDFSNNTPTQDELDVFALARNLYASEIPIRHAVDVMNNVENVDEYLALRSLIAKKSVAENSFFAIAGLRTVNPFEKSNPPSVPPDFTSYYEDMHRLTKRQYQDPAFFANLYDSPANVLRQKAAMQGVGLMQQRDLYESQIRSEMLTSILLETMLEQTTKTDVGRLRQ